MKTKCAVPTCDQPFPFHALDCPVIAPGVLGGSRRATAKFLLAYFGCCWEVVKLKKIEADGRWSEVHRLVAERVANQLAHQQAVIKARMEELRNEF